MKNLNHKITIMVLFLLRKINISEWIEITQHQHCLVKLFYLNSYGITAQVKLTQAI